MSTENKVCAVALKTKKGAIVRAVTTLNTKDESTLAASVLALGATLGIHDEIESARIACVEMLGAFGASQGEVIF